MIMMMMLMMPALLFGLWQHNTETAIMLHLKSRYPSTCNLVQNDGPTKRTIVVQRNSMMFYNVTIWHASFIV